MTKEELDKVLADHKDWLKDLCCADLRYADLRGADPRYANLQGADLRYANLLGADLRYASLQGARLCNADLRYANLQGANLWDADLIDADLRGANLDYSCWPLNCVSFSPRIDKRQAAQLLYHVLRAMRSCTDVPDVAAVLASKANIMLANQFHRVDECGRIEPPEEGGAK